MKKRNYNKLLIIFIIIIVIISIAILFYFQKQIISFSPTSQTIRNYCNDGDSGSLTKQSKTANSASYLYSECEFLQDVGDVRKNCGFIVNADDVCKDNNILLEQTCEGGHLESVEVNCPEDCRSGACR